MNTQLPAAQQRAEAGASDTLAKRLGALLASFFHIVPMLALDFGFSVASLLLALYFNDGDALVGSGVPMLLLNAFLGFLATSGAMAAFRCYKADACDYNASDIPIVAGAFVMGLSLYFVINLGLRSAYPFTVVLNHALLMVLAIGSYRVIFRAYAWMRGRYGARRAEIRNNILIVGAGRAGRYLLNSLVMDRSSCSRVVGFIDDCDELWGESIRGYQVLGGRETIPMFASRYDVNEIIITIPHVDNQTIRDIYGYCQAVKCRVRRFANMSDFTKEGLAKATINDVQLEDLLGRSEIKLSMSAVSAMISGKVVMVTGGAGSIGSEICRQALKYNAARVIVFDFNENGLYEIGTELSEAYDRSRFELVLGSVRDEQRLGEVFLRHKPSVVFHAAAHKHVPMMEYNPFEAITNNVIGTCNVARAASEAGVERFILISTDKAVNPTNIMGASKRLAELAVQYFDSVSDNTVFSAVRFGNVLGSNGSVIPLFKRQIAAGGPVTVTDRDVKRYFMTIPEAVQLVLDAGAMATGSELFVLNMGKPMKIYDLACTMIQLSGYEPERDIKIEITGLRVGEKLFEEISLDSEDVKQTENDQIFVLRSGSSDVSFEDRYEMICDAVSNRDGSGLMCQLEALVPGFADDALRAKLVAVPVRGCRLRRSGRSLQRVRVMAASDAAQRHVDVG